MVHQDFLTARDLLLRHRTDYVRAYAEFQWPALDRFNWALDYFDPMAEGNEALALWIVEEDGSEARHSFADMARRSARMANFLRAQGVGRGDRVLLMLPNCVALWDVMLACIKLGAVMIPATTLLTPTDLEDRIVRGEVRHVVCLPADTAKFAALPQAIWSRVAGRFAAGDAPAGWIALSGADDAPTAFTPYGITNATDPLLLYFTSGTTSKPKLVLHTHQSYPVGTLATMYWIGLQPGDVHWNISSPGWAKHAWSSFFAPWNAGAAIFAFNQSRFNAAATLATLSRCGVTTLCAPPTVWRMLIQEDLKSYPVKLRELVGAGEPLNPEVIERVRSAWGIIIRDGYGQTETCALIGNSPGQPLKPGAMGRPMPGYRIRLVDIDGNPAEEGEVCVETEPRPTGLLVGYAGDAEKTAQALHDGLYHTGDVAQRDADGYYTFVGRTDDVFKSSDYRISPFELESLLIEHPAVAEAAVVPCPDALRLTIPKAFVSCRVGFAPSADLAREILAFVRERAAPYKRIRRIEFFDLPKTISGKIRRVELRKIESTRSPGKRGEQEFYEEDFNG
ncbi:AMP-binding protein [Thiomonas bhubaneswarensis]|uniref:Acyl-coenzyme A synthetase/AMP-(Fatty) acid ligase n=1 Tax=Thiomonas bhubaneswarensis TaxID=339866 RepID=A0A0K6I2R8_9BURK|nr:AMP-binding protein [Thiomonas bhubaneswarensis]CUA97358.1 Acyl-coenzyme A synthetase/AMP-(fatty) acid ligase [Thiomonas bhubaneswarensis]